jgi:lipopolysaccharide transport system ATP-binding protein
MSHEVLIKVENLSKKFCIDLKKSLWYGVKDIALQCTGRSSQMGELRSGEFWSVQDVSFELKRGECMALIGPNGAGKSTLLKMLNGLIKPDRGQITVRGRVGALIELGAGFNPILTGKENIYVNGALLGFTKEEIGRKLDSIIEFSELKDFIDAPVQNYSSGMKVRLGFAIASHMDPDVLLIDEVLAVGDIGFRSKCLNAINNLLEKTAVIFVTHAMPQVSRICSDVTVMSQGRSVFHGKDIPGGIEYYYNFFDREQKCVLGTGKAVVHSICLESNGVREVGTISYLDELAVHIEATIDGSYRNPNIAIVVVNQELQNILHCSSCLSEVIFNNFGQLSEIYIDLGSINLNPGTYSIDLGITSENRKEILVMYRNIKFFTVKGRHMGFAPVLVKGNWQFKSIDKAK